MADLQAWADRSAQDLFVWDSELVGFGLKVTPAGSRTHVVRYRLQGRMRRYTIGPHGSPWTVETAREQARSVLARVVANVDPQVEKERDRAGWTVGELCDLYVTEGLATRKSASRVAARCDIDNHIKPLIGSRLVSSITAEDVDRVLPDVAAGKTARRRKTERKRGVSIVRGGKGAANSAVAVLSAALTFAVRPEIRVGNPALGVRKFPEKRRDRFLSPAEVARLGEALAAAESLGVENPDAIAALRLLILTGCRKNEIVKAERAWVDFTHSCLRLPDSKTGAKVVHLGEPAMELIRKLPAIEGNPYLLPGRGENVPISDLQSCWERIREAAGLPDIRIHDLRHAFASFGAATGESLIVIGALLGHKVARTTERYVHMADTQQKGAVDRISGELARHLGLGAAPRGPAMQPADREERAPPGMTGLLGRVIETRWLDTPAAAEFLGNTVGTLQTWRWMGVGPAFRWIGRRIVYALGDLEAWRARHAARIDAALIQAPANVVVLSERRSALR